jgi:hypothetical protein
MNKKHANREGFGAYLKGCCDMRIKAYEKST